MNTWSHSAEYYDIILGKKRFDASAEFIAKILKKHGVRSVLELGCGTGLYLRPLKKDFAIEGLDISKQMLREAKRIGVPLHLGDMSRFSLQKYDAVLIMNSSLLMLPDMRSIERTIARSARHLKPGGLFIVDLPNHDKEIPQRDGTIEHSIFRTKEGMFKLTEKSYRKGNRWIEEWHGTGKKKFSERFEEIIYDPAKMRSLIEKHFRILDVYGSRTGGKFNKDSYRRLFVCKR